MDERNREMLEFMLVVLLADYDLMDLIEKEERPFDEYGPEARTILKYLESVDYEVKLDVLAYRIQYIFLRWFDKKPSFELCVMIANEIKMMI